MLWKHTVYDFSWRTDTSFLNLKKYVWRLNVNNFSFSKDMYIILATTFSDVA